MANKSQVGGPVREGLMETLSEVIRTVIPPQLPTASKKLGSRICLQAEKLRLRMLNELDGSQLQKAWSVPRALVLNLDIEAVLTHTHTPQALTDC